ncbi:MAG: hypothetical protein ABRQ24_07150 [Syntrophomonadaceae bacterium]
MELDKNERSIFGFFGSSTKAADAVEALKNAGLVEDEGSIQLDQVSRFGTTNDQEYNSPINNATTLHGPTIYSNSAGVDDGANPLLAAEASESGVGANYENQAGGKSFMVVLVTANQNVDQAVSIMKQYGGQV